MLGDPEELEVAANLDAIASNLEAGEGMATYSKKIHKLTNLQRSSLEDLIGVLRDQLVTLLAAAGFRSTPGVLFVPLEQEFGWKRGPLLAERQARSEARRPRLLADDPHAAEADRGAQSALRRGRQGPGRRRLRHAPEGGTPQARVLGTDIRTSTTSAAWANAPARSTVSAP